MSPRARRRRMIRRTFRVLVSMMFFVATSPRAIATAPPHESPTRNSAFNQTEIIARANASTVKIKAQSIQGARRVTSNGAGVVVSASGYILTANHVVKGIHNVRDHGARRESEATLVMVEDDLRSGFEGSSRASPLEVAVLRCQAVRAGTNAVVIGNPSSAWDKASSVASWEPAPSAGDGQRAPLHAVEGAIVKGNLRRRYLRPGNRRTTRH
ncbi:MAG: hypothetical protein U1D30_23020 [Planctomycetota bacterium]